MNLSRFFLKNSVRSQSVRFLFGSVVFQQGQVGEAFYIVQSGRLRVIKQGANGNSTTVGYLYAGDHFGEGALLSGQGHRATVRAVEDADVLQVPKDEFFKAVRKNSDVKAYLEEQVACIAYRDFTRFLKGDVPNQAMRVLFARLKREAVEKGVTVVDQGQFGQRFYLIGRGQLDAVSENGDTVVLRPGDYFGDGRDDKTVIRSRRKSVLFYIDKNDFNKLKAMISRFEAALEKGRISRGEEGPGRELSPVSEPPVVRSVAAKDTESNTAFNVVNIRIDGAKSQGPTWFRFPFLKQHDQSDCGAACLGMMCKYYKMPIGLNRLRDMSNVSRHGTSMAALAEAAETIGFVTRGVRTGYEALMRTELPAILHWEGNHFVVLYHIDKKEVKIADPGVGIRKLSRAEFEKGWTNMALLLEYTDQVAENEPSQSSFKRFFPLIRPYTGILIEVLLASLVLSLFGLASPIFMQTIIDQVLVHHDEDLLNLMLVGMVVVALFQMGTSTLRVYLIGYVSARLSIAMLSRFYRHLLSLSMGFFALRRTGDLTTRFRENATIQRLLTDTTVSAVLDFIMLFVYLGLMFYYNAELTLVMLIFVPLSVGVTLIYTPILKSFSQRAFLARAEQSSVLIDSLARY